MKFPFSIPTVLKANYPWVLLCLSCSLAVCVNLLMREKNVAHHFPTLSLYIPGYMLCFAIAFVGLKVYFLVNEEDPEPWHPIQAPACAWRVLLLGFLIATTLSIQSFNRSMVKDTGAAWTLEIWMAHVPFWAAALAGLLQGENLIFSLGTSLAMTCGCVLMVPLASFTVGWLPNLLAALQSILIASCMVLIHQLMTTYDTSQRKFLTPYQVLLHLSIVVPIFLFLSVGFEEVPQLLEMLSGPMGKPSAMILIHGVVLFAKHILTFILFQKTPLYFGTVIYCVGSSFAFLLTGEWFAIFGMLLVLLTLTFHVKSVSVSLADTSYKQLVIGDAVFVQ
jgi:hypothetical protein